MARSTSADMIAVGKTNAPASSEPLMPATCLICGSGTSSTVLRYETPDAYETAVGVPADGHRRQWVECADCGFHYAQYSYDPSRLAEIYATAYRDTDAAWRQRSIVETFNRIIDLPPNESESWIRIGWIKQEIASLAAAGLLGWSQAPFRLLDVGGATGVFAHLFQFNDADWRASIVDPSEDGQFIEREHGVPYIAAPFAAGLFPHRFHLISMVFALEHLANPADALLRAKADLEPGGLIYIEVPDALAFSRKPADDDIFNACHYWMFSPASLTRLLGQVGLETFAVKRTRTLRGHYALTVLAGPPR